MKEKDIKTLFDQASYTEEDNVNTEEIKSDVLKKLSKTATIAPPQNEEGIKPVFVAQKAKKFPTAKVITAAATAACLGVVSISTGFFGLAQAEQSPLSAGNEIQETTEAAGDNTDNSDSKKYAPRFVPITLKDGDIVEIYDNTEPNTSSGGDSTNRKPILLERDGRVYYIGDGEEEDITGRFDSQTPLIIPYENKDSGLTHYIIIGGNITSGGYGYVEIFKMSENLLHTSEAVHRNTPARFFSSYLTETEWFKNALEQLSDTLGIDPEKALSGGNGAQFDFTGEWDLYELDHMNMEEPGKKCDFANNTFTLKDGTTVEIPVGEIIGVKSDFDTIPAKNRLIAEKDGRLYYQGDEHPMDITDLISMDTPFIIPYENKGSGQTHYIAVGGDFSTGDYGYFEMFMLCEKEYYYEGCKYSGNPDYDHVGFMLNTEWFEKAIMEMAGENAVNYSSCGCIASVDFRESWKYDYEDPEEWLGEKSDFKNNTFTLKDGTKMTIFSDGMSDRILNERTSRIVQEKEGRLYYLGGEEPKDITDLISMDTPFVVSYENEGSGQTHYFAVGGNAATGEYGYVEMFKLREKLINVSMAMNNYDNDQSAFDPVAAEKQEWVQKTIEQMVGASHKDEYQTTAGGTAWDFRITECEKR